MWARLRAAGGRVGKHVRNARSGQVNGTSVRLVLLEARNEGGGRGNPSERVRARPRGAASCVAAEAALVQIVCGVENL